MAHTALACEPRGTECRSVHVGVPKDVYTRAQSKAFPRNPAVAADASATAAPPPVADAPSPAGNLDPELSASHDSDDTLSAGGPSASDTAAADIEAPPPPPQYPHARDSCPIKTFADSVPLGAGELPKRKGFKSAGSIHLYSECGRTVYIGEMVKAESIAQIFTILNFVFGRIGSRLKDICDVRVPPGELPRMHCSRAHAHGEREVSSLALRCRCTVHTLANAHGSVRLTRLPGVDCWARTGA